MHSSDFTLRTSELKGCLRQGGRYEVLEVACWLTPNNNIIETDRKLALDIHRITLRPVMRQCRKSTSQRGYTTVNSNVGTTIRSKAAVTDGVCVS